MPSIAGFRYGLVVVAALSVGAGVAIAVARRAERASESPLPAATELDSLPPGVDVHALMPAFAAADTEGDRRVSSLAAEGKSRLLGGDYAGALRTWREMLRVSGVGDRGALHYVRVLDAHGLKGNIREYFAADFPAEAESEFHRLAAEIYLRDLRFREAHRCFEEIARATGSADDARLVELCYRCALDSGDARAVEEMANRMLSQDVKSSAGRRLLERLCELEPADLGHRRLLESLAASAGSGGR